MRLCVHPEQYVGIYPHLNYFHYLRIISRRIFYLCHDLCLFAICYSAPSPPEFNCFIMSNTYLCDP